MADENGKMVKRFGYRKGKDGEVEAQAFMCAEGEPVPKGWRDSPAKVKLTKGK